jgi:hypothetical protein
MSAIYILQNAWYLPSENTWKDFQMMAMKDIGILTINTNEITFKGSTSNLLINQLHSISYGKQGRDFINNWVKIEYYDSRNELQQAYFADGNSRGWAGIFGGTKKLYNFLINSYLEK